MGKFFKWAWALIPEGAKVWVAGIGIVLILALFAGIIYKIEKRGYDRCEAKYSKAETDHKTEVRPKIVTTEKKYAKVKNEIIQKTGPNNLVGPRVQHAIDSMPAPSDR